MNDIFDKFRLNGKVAIVTGGAGLLGRQFSRTLAQAGAKVVVADLNESEANKVAEELSNSGFPSMGIGVDVTKVDSTRQMVQKTVQIYKRLDILVCSAALDPKFDPQHQGQHANSFEDFPLEAWKQAVDVNLT